MSEWILYTECGIGTMFKEQELYEHFITLLKK
jgi:hypothetical protein